MLIYQASKLKFVTARYICSASTSIGTSPLHLVSSDVAMNKPSARPKPHRSVALDIRPRAAVATSLPVGKFGKAKPVEMTDNDLRAFGHALLAEPAPAPNAALVRIMKKAQA